MSRRDARDLLRAQAHHQVVVVGVVGHVAGHVGLLEPADPVLETRASPESPTAGRASDSSRRYGMNVAVRQFGSVANVDRDVRQRRRRRASSHGSEPFARYASREQEHGRAVLRSRSARPRSRRRSSPPGVAAATTGTGDSELRPNSTISRSACSGFVGIPCRRARALDVEDQQRQLERDREPDRLLLQHDARPR